MGLVAPKVTPASQGEAEWCNLFAFMLPRLVYRTVFDGLFNKAYGQQLTEAHRQQILELGVDLKKLRPAYPAELFETSINLLRQWMHPEMNDRQAFETMGQNMNEGFLNTPLGGVLRIVLKFLTPEGMLRRAKDNISSGVSFIDTTVTQNGERNFTIYVSDASSHPGFIAGSLAGGIMMVGAKNVKVDYTDRLPHVTYQITWS
jgi:uncharacterized protein (TIGR02265 family)